LCHLFHPGSQSGTLVRSNHLAAMCINITVPQLFTFLKPGAGSIKKLATSIYHYCSAAVCTAVES